jgi:hypothetical protein
LESILAELENVAIDSLLIHGWAAGGSILAGSREQGRVVASSCLGIAHVVDKSIIIGAIAVSDQGLVVDLVGVALLELSVDAWAIVAEDGGAVGVLSSGDGSQGK